MLFDALSINILNSSAALLFLNKLHFFTFAQKFHQFSTNCNWHLFQPSPINSSTLSFLSIKNNITLLFTPPRTALLNVVQHLIHTLPSMHRCKNCRLDRLTSQLSPFACYTISLCWFGICSPIPKMSSISRPLASDILHFFNFALLARSTRPSLCTSFLCHFAQNSMLYNFSLCTHALSLLLQLQSHQKFLIFCTFTYIFIKFILHYPVLLYLILLRIQCSTTSLFALVHYFYYFSFNSIRLLHVLQSIPLLIPRILTFSLYFLNQSCLIFNALFIDITLVFIASLFNPSYFFLLVVQLDTVANHSLL